MDGSFHCIFNGIQSFEIKTIESEFIEDKRTALVKKHRIINMDKHVLHAYYNKIGEENYKQIVLLAQLMQKWNYLMF
jgi:hypothetical protein